MTRGNFRTSDKVCPFSGEHNETVTIYKIGKGANKVYLYEKHFNKPSESKEENIEKYENKR